jgi:uncharacterized protein
VTASHCYENDTPIAVADGRKPKDSNDHAIPRFTWWPHKGSAEWIQRELGPRREVKSVSVYWFDDAPRNGGCRVPKSWRVTYRHNGEWRAVEDASAAGVERDKANAVTFKPVTTDALRLEVRLQDGFSAGILEWTVE